MIVFDGSTWHGFTANRSGRRRRSIQGAFVPREGRQAIDQAARLLPETRDRLGPLARYLLDVPGAEGAAPG
jgi:ectoine hydroxylase-related dioxygenase (phytanoyl-CoA dioxygenase family)